MPVQPQLILLQKTLLNVEGLGRQLYPELDIWSTASPILREWMRERTSVRTLLGTLRRHAPALLAAAEQLPVQLERALRTPPAQASAALTSLELAALRTELRHTARRREAGTFAAVLLLLAGLWLIAHRQPPWPAWVCGGAALALLLGALRR